MLSRGSWYAMLLCGVSACVCACVCFLFATSVSLIQLPDGDTLSSGGAGDVVQQRKERCLCALVLLNREDVDSTE